MPTVRVSNARAPILSRAAAVAFLFAVGSITPKATSETCHDCVPATTHTSTPTWCDMLGSVSAKLAMLDSAVQSLGPFAAPVYALTLVVSGMIPLPAFNVLVLGAGSLFGATLGFGVVYPAALAGASLGFFLGRRMPASLRRRIPQKLTMLQGALADGGFTTLLLLRLTPLPFAPSNLFLGSIPAVPFGTYIAATALGFLRLCVNVLIGSRVRGMIDGEGTALEQGLVAGGALTFALALGNICRMLLKRKAAESKQGE